MHQFSIKDLESLSGIKAHTFRIWESRYKLLEPKRNKANFRYYSLEDVKQSLRIALLVQNGFRISKVASLGEDEKERIVSQIKNTEVQIEKSLHRLFLRMAELDIDGFENEIDNSILSFGIKRVISEIIFVFRMKSEILWQANKYNALYKQFSENILRQKIVKGIEESTVPANEAKNMLLFLPSGQYDEIPLLWLHYQLKEQGFQIIYMGVDFSVNDLKKIIEFKKPRFICTLVSLSKSANILIDYLIGLDKKEIEKIYVIATQLLLINKIKSAAHIICLPDAREALNTISRLSEQN